MKDSWAVHLVVPERGETLAVTSFRGVERVSALYRIEARVAASATSEELLGERVALILGAARPERVIHGVVARVEARGRVAHDHETFSVLVVPAMWRLKRRRTRRIFQQRTSLEIAAQIFGEHHVAHRLAVASPPPSREYAVQYDETDEAFLARLFAEDGLFYFVEHPLATDGSATEVVVIGGDTASCPVISGEPALRYERLATEGALAADEDQIGSFEVRSRVRSRRTLNRGYDFRRPRTELRDEAQSPVTPADDVGSLYEHAGGFEADPGLRSAKLRLEQERRGAVVAEGEGACRRLVPGHRFELRGHEAPELEGPYTITRVEHEGYSARTAPEGRAVYRSRFRCVPAQVPVRPRYAVPKPRQVAETAVVVGPPGQEIFTDSMGRIKVQFHWDLDGRRDAESSCWIRVAQAWAGAGWGAQVIPRVGMEVVIAYLGGDVDRPLVTGCVYNAVNPPAFALPEQKTRSGIRTRSTPDSVGWNEISFEDATGGEEIRVHAQRDYRELVRREHESRVEGNRSEETQGHASARVTRSVTEEIGEGRSVAVRKDDRLQVGGDAQLTVTGDRSVLVVGGHLTSVLGDASDHVHGDRSVVTGSPAKPSQSDEYVYGGATLAVAERLTLRAEKGISIECGEATIELCPDKIVMRAPTIEISPKDTLECRTKDGPVVTLADDVEILSKKLRVFTDGGALEIDQDFKAKGGTIKLGYNPSEPSKDSEDQSPETKKFQCKLSDYFLRPYANKKYHLFAEGRRFEGTTDGDGKVEVEIPALAKRATLRLWIDNYPEGRQRLYTFALSKDPPPPGVSGAKRRLHNLGYYKGPINDVADDELRLALAEFQDDHRDTHGLLATGELDEGTAGALEEIHGH